MYRVVVRPLSQPVGVITAVTVKLVVAAGIRIKYIGAYIPTYNVIACTAPMAHQSKFAHPPFRPVFFKYQLLHLRRDIARKVVLHRQTVRHRSVAVCINRTQQLYD